MLQLHSKYSTRRMIMRFLSLLLFMCFAMISFASPYVNNAAQLEKIFDDYSFSLNVEWDQEDEQFYDQNTQVILKSIEILILNEGMNKKDFENFIILKIKKPLIVKQIQTRLTFLPEEASPQELAQAFKDIAKEFSSDFYSQGANWNGGVIISTTLALVIVAVLGY